jgi:signal transduction histidine kinase
VKRILFYIIFGIIPVVLEAQMNFFLYVSENQSIQPLSTALFDQKNAYTPEKAFEMFRTAEGTELTTTTPKRDSQTLSSTWYWINVHNESGVDYVYLSIFLPRMNNVYAYKSDDEGRSFIELPKHINEISDTRIVQGSTGDTIAQPPARSRYFPPESFVNYLISIIDLSKTKETIVLLRIEFRESPGPFDIEMSGRRAEKRGARAVNNAITITFGLLIIAVFFFYTKTKDAANIVFIALALIDAFYLYISVGGYWKPSRSFFNVIEVTRFIYPLLWCVFHAQLLNVPLLRSKPFWGLMFLGILEMLGIIAVNSISILTQDFILYVRAYFTSIVVLFVALVLFIIRKKIALPRHQRAYYLLSFLLPIAIVLDTVIFLIFTTKPIFGVNPYLFSKFFHIFSFFILLAYRVLLFLQQQKQEKINKELNYQREISKEVIKALEDERSRLAKDLHDEIGNDLAIIKMSLHKLDLDEHTKSNIFPLIDKATSDVRNISHNLMPPRFIETDFITLVSSYCSQLNEYAPIQFHFHSSGAPCHFGKSEELMIYRIIMELTNNIIKHSHAFEATVQLIYYDTHLEIMLEDNGTKSMGDFKPGLGIKSIESRVDFLNGRLSVDSNATGTTSIIEIPYPNDSKA